MEETPTEDPKHELPFAENPNLSEDGPQSPLSNYDSFASEDENDPLVLEVGSLRIANQELQSRCSAMEEALEGLRGKNADLAKSLDEAVGDQDSLRMKVIHTEMVMGEREEEILEERFALVNEIEVIRATLAEILDERCRRVGSSSEILTLMRSVKEGVLSIVERIDADEKCESSVETLSGSGDEFGVLLSEMRFLHKLGLNAMSKFGKYEEIVKRERNEFENTIMHLTEENRDLGILLKIAVREKEAVEKKLEQSSGEQKRAGILQIAERGLQKVGFGFMMGFSTGESTSDNPSSSNSSTKFNGSECDEEGITSLASTVEKIMKNLRIEISQLKQSLENSRSDCEHLQILTDKQTQDINNNTLRIKDLEGRESMLSQNVEDLIMEIKVAEEEAFRWREACEMEVEAGKSAIEEHEKEAAILREELKRTQTALDTANKKLELKEKLATTAMAAQAAAEASLRIADRRATELRDRIEELTRQIDEEVDRNRRQRARQRVRHVCWPWQALRITPTAASIGRSRNLSRGVPQMLPLFQ